MSEDCAACAWGIDLEHIDGCECAARIRALEARVKELETGAIPCDRCESLVLALEAELVVYREPIPGLEKTWRSRAEKAEAALAELAEYRLSNDGRSLSIEKCSRTYQIAKRAAGRESGSPKG